MDTGAAPRLEIKDLCRSFAGKKVVDDVSLTIEPGQVTCLLGPSGCGKSTVLRMIAGVDCPDHGQVRMDGTVMSCNISNMPPEQRRIGMMFQDFALFPHMTVEENVAFGLAGGPRKNEMRVEELLAQVGMQSYRKAFPHELSGGEQQRIALARALAPRPKVMLLDEPFSGLDDRLRDDVRDETLDLLVSEGTAVLLVTHEPAEAMRMADEIALMRGGKIVQRGTPADVYHNPIDRDAAAFFSDVNVVTGVVHDGRMETILGRFPAHDLADGTPAEVVFRPQHLQLDFGRSGRGPAPSPERGKPACVRVERARFMGTDSLLELRMSDGTKIRALMRGVFVPKQGAEFWVSLNRKHGFVFPL